MASSLSGPKLDETKEYLIDWYARKRIELIEAFEEVYPYGSKPLSNSEQLAQFQQRLLNPESWTVLIASLHERYRGLPDAAQRVDQDIQDYIRSMRSLTSGMRIVQ